MVWTYSAFLNEKLGEFHDSGDAAVSSVAICDNRPEVIDWRIGGSFLTRHPATLLSLSSTVRQTFGIWKFLADKSKKLSKKSIIVTMSCPKFYYHHHLCKLMK